MTALGADSQREKRGTGRIMVFPVATGVTIYKNGIVGINAGGFAVPGADTAGLQVAGIAYEQVVNSGADGAKKIRVEVEAEWLFAASSITQAMLGDLMVIVDDNTVDDAAGPTNDVPVGRLTEFISTTLGWVYVPGMTTL